tara:strand:- start:55 stop:969 length:915 start_codon:yes stop_codon:yes gene_type:complete
MGFLDNSGDIILDAVLTDTGRMRLAKGDGSFKIAKFALGDDEVDYSLYDKNNASGSAYFDINILTTPVLEAFTDNAASMKSKLISIPATNLLYLPIMKLNELYPKTAMHSSGAFMVAVDQDTEEAVTINTDGAAVDGIIPGFTLVGGTSIRSDQGLDTTEISPASTIDSQLLETQYIVEIDNRLGKIVNYKNGNTAKVSYIDDDNVASYYFTSGVDQDFVRENTDKETSTGTKEVIAGPRGTIFQFSIGASLETNTSDFLFTQLGSTATLEGSSVYFIDSIVRINGATTGYKLDIPVRFVKLVS